MAFSAGGVGMESYEFGVSRARGIDFSEAVAVGNRGLTLRGRAASGE